jgi:transcriptional regulator with GAF, ATPase, and Fis domain
MAKMIAADRLAEIFVDAADTLVDDFDVVEFLETLTHHTAQVSSAAFAGLLLASPSGQLQYMASSAESIKLLELFQLQHHEGPCLDCYRTGEPVVNADLSTAAAQWPLFAPRALAAGFHAVHAFPLRHQRKVIGALNLFSKDTGPVEPHDARIIQSLADIATIALLQERSIRSGEVLAEQLQSALNSRIMIEQAKGALARMLGVDVGTAFEVMRTYARNNHHRLSDVAQSVLADPGSHPELTDPGRRPGHTGAGA